MLGWAAGQRSPPSWVNECNRDLSLFERIASYWRTDQELQPQFFFAIPCDRGYFTLSMSGSFHDLSK